MIKQRIFSWYSRHTKIMTVAFYPENIGYYVLCATYPFNADLRQISRYAKAYFKERILLKKHIQIQCATSNKIFPL